MFVTRKLINVILFIISMGHITSKVIAEQATDLVFIDDDGVAHKIDLEEDPTARSSIFGALSLQYLLFTRANPTTPQYLIKNDANSIRSSNYDPNVSTVILIHGWRGEALDNSFNKELRTVFLSKSYVNVISVDWSTVSHLDYVSAVTSVPVLGRNVGSFLRFLSDTTGAAFNNFFIVGFSLGAHMAGIAGREIRGQAGRVQGLDPAGPLWYINDNRLKPTDAKYVEAIHTNAGTLGIQMNVAQADFYPNGGSSQPECGTGLFMASCNHGRSWQLFAASITRNNFVARHCTGKLLRDCNGNTLLMGNDDLKKTGSGVYYLLTTGTYPYYKS